MERSNGLICLDMKVLHFCASSKSLIICARRLIVASIRFDLVVLLLLLIFLDFKTVDDFDEAKCFLLVIVVELCECKLGNDCCRFRL